jgi:ubiquinone/menaquinone biosynthesis C-methylase UbiE
MVILNQGFQLIGERWRRYWTYYRAYSRDIFWPLELDERPILLKMTMASISQYLKHGIILDAGTGPGDLPAILTEFSSEVTVVGIDIEKLLLDDAKRRVINNKTDDQVRFIQANVQDLPFSAKKFDMIISVASLHLWRDRDKAIKELHRVLVDEGLIVVVVGKQRIYPGNFFFLDFFTKKSVKYITSIFSKAGFKEVILESPESHLYRVIARK